jgi:predicted transcriptional regulator
MLNTIKDISVAYFTKNPVPVADIGLVIAEIAKAARSAENDDLIEAPVELKPACSIKSSVKEDHIVCLEDGKKFKSLKRHLRTHYNLSPEDYRKRWGLPVDYPMVAPAYALARSNLAKKMGLGVRKARGGK